MIKNQDFKIIKISGVLNNFEFIVIGVKHLWE